MTASSLRKGYVPRFETERLILRGVTATDIGAYTEDFVDWEVVQTLSAAVPWPYPDGGVREHVLHEILPRQGDDFWFWSICLKSYPTRQIGNVQLWFPGTPENRGFWLARKHWGNGYMTEAVHPVMDFAFETLGHERLTFTNALGNDRSRRVKEKTGARLIDVQPADYVDKALRQQELWSLTRAEWRARRRKPPQVREPCT
ncbi:MAG: GNAT family N-acetyltransferase [Pseudomonadota bacterium]